MATTVFVYGTLKKGFHNDWYLRKAKFLGTATVPRLRLIDLGWGVPGVVDGQGGVEGELYEVEDEDLLKLDKLEGTQFGVYQRQTRKANLGENVVPADVYVYLRETGNEKVVESGVWGK